MVAGLLAASPGCGGSTDDEGGDAGDSNSGILSGVTLNTSVNSDSATEDGDGEWEYRGTAPGQFNVTIELNGLDVAQSTRAKVEVVSATALEALPEKPRFVDLVPDGEQHVGSYSQPFTSFGMVRLRVTAFDRVSIVTVTVSAPEQADFELTWNNPETWNQYGVDCETEQTLSPTVCVSDDSEECTTPDDVDVSSLGAAKWTATAPGVLLSETTELDTDKKTSAELFVPGKVSEEASVPITITVTVAGKTIQRVISPSGECP